MWRRIVHRGMIHAMSTANERWMLLYSFLERSTMHERVFAGALRGPAVIRRLEVLRRGAVPCSDRATHSFFDF